MTLNEISNYIDSKITSNSRIIIFTFYEIRVKLNLYEDEANELIELIKIRLNNLGYKTYLTGAKYSYENISKVVNKNELLVAIKRIDKK